MATIRTTISVQDGLSQAFNRMTQSIQQTNQQYARIQQLVQQGLNDGTINNANNAQQRLNNSANQGVSIFDRMKNSIVGIGLALGAAFSVRNIVRASDELSQTIGRLNLANDGLQTTQELQDAIYRSAQRTGNAYSVVASTVAGLSLRAGDAFSSNQEVIQFSENLNKLFSIAGASQQEVASATLQLTQALGSGVLRGEELNAVFEAAPNVIKTVANYMDQPIGKIRELAKEGQLSADIVRRALLSATDEINQQFATIPSTSENAFNRIKNTALFAFQDILIGINDVFNSDRFNGFANSISNALVLIANTVTPIFNFLVSVGALIYDNWAFISPIFVGVAVALGLMATQWLLVATYTAIATTALNIFNAAIAASPIRLFFIILGAIVGVVTLAINVFNHFAGSSVSAIGVIVGALLAAFAIIGNVLLGGYTVIVEVFKSIYNIVATFAEFLANVFQNPLRAAAQLFSGFAQGVIGIVKSLAKAIDKVFGSNLASGLTNVQTKLGDFVDNKYGENSIQIKRFAEDDFDLKRYNIGQAYNYGYDLGSQFSSSLSNSNYDPGAIENPATSLLSGIAGDIGDIKKDANKTAKNTDISKEDLKYLRDAAYANALDRFSGVNITIDMQNNNNISNFADIDGIVDSLAERLEETLYSTAEGL